MESSREVVNGYNVVYRYNGRDVNVALPYDPGSTLKVAVGVVLDERAADSGRDTGREPARDSMRAPERGAYRTAQPVMAADPGVATNNAGYSYRY